MSSKTKTKHERPKPSDLPDDGPTDDELLELEAEEAELQAVQLPTQQEEEIIDPPPEPEPDPGWLTIRRLYGK